MPKEPYRFREESKRFAEEVKKLIESGVERQEIAYKSGIAYSVLSAILAGTRNVPVSAANKFSEAYGVNIMTGSDSMQILSETVTKILAGVNANRMAISAIYAKAHKLEPEKAVEILGDLYDSELKKLKAELKSQE
jgi:predicted transcriptional regulator